MRNMRSYEWVGIIVTLVVVGFLTVEGVFGNLLNPEARDLVELPHNNVGAMNNENQNPLIVETLVEGHGDRVVKPHDELTVHYTGTLQNGSVFDSSVSRGTPFVFVIGQGNVIQGWEEGLLGMKVGEKRRLTIMPSKAYGAAAGHRLQNETLIFEVELLGIE